MVVAIQRLVPPEPIFGMTLQSLIVNYELFTETWESSDAYQEGSTFFRETLLKRSLAITSCVRLCLVSITAQDELMVQ